MDRRLSVLAGLLLATTVAPVLQAQEAPASPPSDESLLGTIVRDVGNDPAALEKAVRERLAATQDAGMRRELTVTLAGLLVQRTDRYGGAAEVLCDAEGWASAADIEEMASEIVQRAWVNGALGKLLAAVEGLVKARPESRALWVLIARASVRNDDPARAIEAWERAHRIEATASGYRLLAAALRGAKRYEEALAAAQQAGELSVVDRAHLIGYSLVDLGRTEDAMKLASELAATPDITVADLRQVAWLYGRCEARDQQVAVLGRALGAAETEADRAQLESDLGGVHEKVGDLDAAFAHYKVAGLAGDPDAKMWLGRHATDRLEEPAAFDEALAACFAGWYPGWDENYVPRVGSRWFERWRSLPEYTRVIVDNAEKAGKLAELLAAATEGLTRTPGSLGHLVVLIAGRYKAGDLAGSAEAARMLYEAQPEVMPTDRLAAAYEEAGNHEQAAEYFARSDPPQWMSESSRWAGKCYAARGEIGRIDEVAARLRERAPKAAPATGEVLQWLDYREGLLRLGAGQAERAIPLLENSPRTRETQALASDLARAYAAVGRTDDAVASFTRALARGDEWWLDEASELARVLAEHQTPEQYLARFAQIMRENQPASGGLLASVWRKLVDAEADAGRLDQLAQALKRETERNAGDSAIWAVLGLAQTKAEDYEAAVASFAEASKGGAGRWMFLDEYQLASDRQRERSPASRGQNAWQDFQQGFRPALQAGDMDRAAEIACNLVAAFGDGQTEQRDSIAMQVAQLAEAAKPYDAFIAAVAIRAEQAPDECGPTLLLAHCYYQNKQHDRTIDTIIEAAKLLDTDAGAWVLLGRAHRQLGHWADAADAWRKALELAPSEAARHSIQKLLDEARTQGP
jgi:tetratricopeptide (TPR) repeat protein